MAADRYIGESGATGLPCSAVGLPLRPGADDPIRQQNHLYIAKLLNVDTSGNGGLAQVHSHNLVSRGIPTW
jgi:hypothetical protein